METSDLRVEVKNRVGILTMNRPDKLNALTPAMNDAAVAALREMAVNPEVGAVILTGAGRGFCAGGDVSAMHRGEEIAAAGATLEQQVDTLRERHEWPWLLHSVPKVTVAVRRQTPQEQRRFDAALELLLQEVVRQEIARRRDMIYGEANASRQTVHRAGPL